MPTADIRVFLDAMLLYHLLAVFQAVRKGDDKPVSTPCQELQILLAVKSPVHDETSVFYLYLVTLTGLGELFLNMENPPFQANGAFSISTFLFLLIALPLLGRRKPIEILSVAVLTTAVLVFAFGWFFQVLLP